MVDFSRHWRRGIKALGIALVGWALLPIAVWAQAISPELRDQFLSDPELTEPLDSLLPVLPVIRPLSPLEKVDLAVALDLLNAEADRLYQRGAVDEAFEQWIREVRLRRVLGYEAELRALGRVGFRAWENARTTETQLLTLRLRQIQGDLLAQDPLNLELLEGVARVFEVLRDVDSAIAVYDALITQAMEANRPAQQIQLLERKGALEESWFRFGAAAQTYRTLLNLVDGGGAVAIAARVGYLQRAISNYQNDGQLSPTIDLQQRLLAQYEAQGRTDAIAPLQLAIARNYRDIDRPDLALPQYQAAHSLALAQNQSSYARDVVQDLAAIYLALDRPEDVKYLYDQQLAVERLSYNGYGIMRVFDQLGQFYEKQDDPRAAIAAYQEGLILARHLGHLETYFKYQIRRVQLAQVPEPPRPEIRHQGDRDRQILVRPNDWRGN